MNRVILAIMGVMAAAIGFAFLGAYVGARVLEQVTLRVVRVAVAFRPGDRSSELERDELVAALEEVSREVVALGLPVGVVAVPYHDPADFEARLVRNAPACVYVCASLDPMVKEITWAAQRHGVLTASSSRRMAESGLALALVNRGKRAGIVVNLPAAKAAGADLDAALLAIAEVIP